MRLSDMELKKKWVINVSEEVYKYILKKSKPLIDTPDSTLRRIFRISPKKKITKI